MEHSVLNSYFFLPNTSHEVLGINAEEETERSQESEMVDDFKEQVLSIQNRTVGHKNSERL